MSITVKDVTEAIERGEFSAGDILSALDETRSEHDRAILELAGESRLLSGGELELDNLAIVSKGDDNGAYVSVWMWVDFSGTELDEKPEGGEDDD